MKLLIAEKLDENACLDFLSKYGKGNLTNSILKYINEDDGLTLLDKYLKWVEWKDTNRINFGGEIKPIKSASFGEKTFFIYDWGKVQAWSELFEYLYLSQKGEI